MIRKLIFLLTLALVAGTAIVSRAEARAPLTRHTRDAVVSGQAPLVGHLPANQSMRIVLVLPIRNQAGLESLLRDVYNPSSASYRRFLTVKQFTETFGPSLQDYNSVLQFATANGLTVVKTSRNRMNIDVVGTVANIEKALHVTLGLYQHPTENRIFFAIDREPTPDTIPLWHIAGLDNYSIPKPALVRRNASSARVKSNATIGSGPDQSFLGSDMRAAYYEDTTLTGSGQSLGLLEFAGTDLTDLDTYFSNVGQVNNVPITLLSTDGTSTSCTDNKAGDFCDDTEQTIDMTQSLGMAPGMSSLVMYVGSTDAAIFNAMATANPLNAQLSSSWVWKPADPTTDNPYFLEFQIQGQNLFQAAGDSGKWNSGSEVWPADSQYVTAVGGTDLTTSSAGGPWASETAWSDGGGGISPNKIPIPWWQLATAAGCSECSQVYRNDPDVSANANFSFYVCADQTACSANLYGGTSFAAPMWAGYLALVNQQAVSDGDSTLGFINPTIYDIGLGPDYDNDFHDITSGSNGFKATVGYDLATGWGSPNAGTPLITDLINGEHSSFTLSAKPSTVTVAQGSSGTSTITSTVTGSFPEYVSLTAAGAPSGVTVSFSPAAITGSGTSTMTMAVASTVAPGTYTITVTGSGTIQATTTVSLTVTSSSSGSFTLAAKPATVTVAQGATGTSKVTATPSGGFDSAIALSATGQPTGVTVNFKPASIAGGSGSSAVQIKVASTAKTGTYTITITGTGGGVTATTKITLTITT